MTGPEHYREAEGWLQAHADFIEEGEGDNFYLMRILANAQVHATLALAAATMSTDRIDPGYAQAWCEVLGYPIPGRDDDD